MMVKYKALGAWIVFGLVSSTAVYYATLPVPTDLPSPWTFRLLTLQLDIATTIYLRLLPLRMRAIVNRLPGLMDHPSINKTESVANGVPVIIYQPKALATSSSAAARQELLPAIIYVHGGAWTMGSVYIYDEVVTHISVSLEDVIVMSVGYRLAPMHIFPAAFDDVLTATVWLLSNTNHLNIDPSRIAIMGDSAGGNLAAAVAQRLSFDLTHRHLPILKLQVLIYPALQLFDMQTPSNQQNRDWSSVVMNQRSTVQAWNTYLTGNKDLTEKMLHNQHTSSAAKRSPEASVILSHDYIPDQYKNTGYVKPSHLDFGDESVYNEIKDTLWNPDFAPLMREDLHGLPSAYIMTCQYDVLRDDGIIYAQRLRQVGVNVTWNHYEHGVHGEFDLRIKNLLALDQNTRDVVDDVYQYLKTQL